MSLLPEYKLHGIKAFISKVFLKLPNTTVDRCVFRHTHKLVAIARFSLSPPAYALD